VEGLLARYTSRGNLTDEHRTILRSAAQVWAGGFDDDYLEASADPLAQSSRHKAGGGATAGWQRVDQVRVAAARQLALNRSLHETLRDDPETAKQVKHDRRVFVPLKRP